jgi:hypothetical protein
MPIQRIHAEDYEKFLSAAAIKQWGQPLSDESISEILNQRTTGRSTNNFDF